MPSNNDTRKKQKRTTIDGDVTVDGDSSSSSTHVHIISLSFGNILQKFPDLFMYILPCINDRTIFNSIASCNRDTHEKSKAIVPPWPTCYRFSDSNVFSIAVWSPSGTRVAYTDRNVITIVDQRHGVIHRINNYHGVYYCDLKFSPDGRYLVSTDDYSIVKLWDNNVAGNYEQLQEWNMREEIGDNGDHESDSCSIDISACNKYIVMVSSILYRVFLKGVENSETIGFLTPPQVMMNITKVMFSVDYRAVFIYGWIEKSNFIKLWRPYLDNTDENNLTTLWEQKNCDPKIIVSHDKTMIAIQNINDVDKGWLLSIDNNYSCTVQKLNIRISDKLLQFTPDDECIIFAIKNGLTYWSVAERKFTDNNKCLLYTMDNLEVVNCSPNNRQLIVKDKFQVGRPVSLYIKTNF